MNSLLADDQTCPTTRLVEHRRHMYQDPFYINAVPQAEQSGMSYTN